MTYVIRRGAPRRHRRRSGRRRHRRSEEGHPHGRRAAPVHRHRGQDRELPGRRLPSSTALPPDTRLLIGSCTSRAPGPTMRTDAGRPGYPTRWRSPPNRSWPRNDHACPGRRRRCALGNRRRGPTVPTPTCARPSKPAGPATSSSSPATTRRSPKRLSSGPTCWPESCPHEPGSNAPQAPEPRDCAYQPGRPVRPRRSPPVPLVLLATSPSSPRPQRP